MNEPVVLMAEKVTECSHTPGPWKAVLHFGQWAVRQDPLNWDGMGYQSIGHVGRFHADRKGTHYGDMFKANAHLIAAAPDLYATLNDVLDSFDRQTMEEMLRKDNDAHDDDEFCVNLTAKQLRAINQAILKAEGKV